MAYIYEYIRTRGHEPLYFEEHCIYLEAGAVRYFGEPLKPSRNELLSAIKEVLQRGRFSPTVMNAVEVRYFHDGRFEVEAKEIIYSTFSLRALHPRAYLHRISGKSLLDNTSAKEALIEFHRTTSQSLERSVALWADANDEVLAIDGEPVIAIFEDEIRFSRKGESVEFDHAYDTVVEMGRNATKGAISLADLKEAKELLFIGHEGISAVHRFDTTLYMDITAEKIASKIAEKESL